MKIVIIAAVANNNVVGFNGSVPWHSFEDMKFFKDTTVGFPVIMGRKTFHSLPNILPHRINIVISNSMQQMKGILVFKSLPDAFNYCEEMKFDKIFIIGGGQVYNQSILYADELIISKFDIDKQGDVFFPEINERIWELKNKIDFNGFSVYNYFRKLI